jgi:uncharacterized protein with GYD domain
LATASRVVLNSCKGLASFIGITLFGERPRVATSSHAIDRRRLAIRQMGATVEKSDQREVVMPLYLYQGAYTSQSWAAQLKNPQNRIESVGRQACEAVGGKYVGGWYSFGEYDIVLIADVPNNESMAAIAIAVGAGGGVKASKTTPLMTGAQAVEAIKKAGDVARVYKPAT